MNRRRVKQMRNSSRTWLWRENRSFARSIVSGSKVLDAGAGEQPYRELFSHCDYESADFEKVDKTYAKSTYVCDLSAIPVESERYDAIVFNQVMEHLPEPASVLDELFRVLKPQGRMICTVPLFFEEHEQPYDYYRYTQFGLRHLIMGAGFDIERLGWLEGYFGTVAYQLKCASKYLPWRASAGLPGMLSMPFLAVSKIAFRLAVPIYYWLDESGKYVDSGYPKNYVVIARKP